MASYFFSAAGVTVVAEGSFLAMAANFFLVIFAEVVGCFFLVIFVEVVVAGCFFLVVFVEVAVLVGWCTNWVGGLTVGTQMCTGFLTNTFSGLAGLVWTDLDLDLAGLDWTDLDLDLAGLGFPIFFLFLDRWTSAQRTNGK
jgi:hypothetical protein